MKSTSEINVATSGVVQLTPGLKNTGSGQVTFHEFGCRANCGIARPARPGQPIVRDGGRRIKKTEIVVIQVDPVLEPSTKAFAVHLRGELESGAAGELESELNAVSQMVIREELTTVF